MSGLTATQGTPRVASASRKRADREDRVDRDVRVARRDEDQIAPAIASSVPGAGRALAAPSKRKRVDLVAVPARDEPLLERERAGRRVEPRAQRVVGRGRMRVSTRAPRRAAR
jgi:hypothetical protein